VHRQLRGCRLGCFLKHFGLGLQPILQLMALVPSAFLEQFIGSNANPFQELRCRSRLSACRVRSRRGALSAHFVAPSQVRGVCILGDGLSRAAMNVCSVMNGRACPCPLPLGQFGPAAPIDQWFSSPGFGLPPLPGPTGASRGCCMCSPIAIRRERGSNPR
jgi:hypothetical protein